MRSPMEQSDGGGWTGTGALYQASGRHGAGAVGIRYFHTLENARGGLASACAWIGGQRGQGRYADGSFGNVVETGDRKIVAGTPPVRGQAQHQAQRDGVV